MTAFLISIIELLLAGIHLMSFRTGVTYDYICACWSQIELKSSEYFVIYSRYASMCSHIRSNSKKAC